MVIGGRIIVENSIANCEEGWSELSVDFWVNSVKVFRSEIVYYVFLSIYTMHYSPTHFIISSFYIRCANLNLPMSHVHQTLSEKKKN